MNNESGKVKKIVTEVFVVTTISSLSYLSATDPNYLSQLIDDTQSYSYTSLVNYEPPTITVPEYINVSNGKFNILMSNATVLATILSNA